MLTCNLADVFATPLPQTESLASRSTCIVPTGPIPIGTECFKSGPHAGQCITFECLIHPNACGCPGAPPEHELQERSVPESVDCRLGGGCGPIVVPPTIPEQQKRSVPLSVDCPLGVGCGPIVVPPTIPEQQERSVPLSVDCPLGKGCGPIVVPPIEPVAASMSKRSLLSTRACTKLTGPIPIGEQCFTNGPHAGQCIPFYCLQRPDTCGCPGAPPPV